MQIRSVFIKSVWAGLALWSAGACTISFPGYDAPTSALAILLGGSNRLNQAPASLSFADPAMVFTINASIVDQTPTYSGSITACSTSPALPAGLSLDANSCTISGTPTVLQSATSYVITAANSSGETTATISITVNANPPSALNYPGDPYTFTQNAALSTITPTYSGSVTGCTSSPALPTGLSIDNPTCAISGTPTGFQSSTAYTITASNAFGSTTFTLNIAINQQAPSALNYAGHPYTFTKGVSVGSLVPTYTGTISSCSASPALPTGLSINASDCTISGTPSALQSASSYTIIASNSGGSTNFSLSITVNDQAPTSLNYAGSPYVFTKDSAISPITPTFTGTLTSCSASPGLPAGLALNNTTCGISGTPTALQSATAYTITASNSGGSTNAGITITINEAAPSGLTYSGSPYAFTKDAAITTITPTVSGTVTSCTSSPSLPSGLSLNSITCAISGTPTGTQSSSSYTITASNSGGSTNTSISITVNMAAPSGLTYTGSPFTFTQAASIGTITPTYSGTITTCTSSPSLPSGLSLNNTTCALMGTPSNVQSASSYTITASNAGGSTNTSISITVNEAPPSSLSYAGSPFSLYRNEVMSTLTVTVTGTITSCSVSPALPAGIALNTTTCAISGTPTTIQSSSNYTITASNGGGSTNTSIDIAIVPRVTWITVGMDGAFYSIDNGLNWSASSGDGTGMNAVATDELGRWMAVAISGGIYQSIDGGVNWTTLTSPTANNLKAIATDKAGNWIAAGDSGTIIYTGNNGSSWNSSACTGLNKIEDIAYYGGVWTAVGNDGGGPPSGVICYSTDNGASWSTATGSYTADVIFNIAVSGDGTRAMVGAIGPPPSTGAAFTSSDGQAIAAATLSGVLRDVAGSSGSYFVGVGENGILRFSSDGSTWTAGSTITASHLNAIATDSSSNWVSVSENGSIFYSSSATPSSWNSASASGTSNPLRDISYGIK